MDFKIPNNQFYLGNCVKEAQIFKKIQHVFNVKIFYALLNLVSKVLFRIASVLFQSRIEGK
jgi:hypothetical protein